MGILFIQFQANYMEYSRVQCKYVNMQSTVLYYFKKIKQRLYITLEIKNLLWNFNLKWFLCEGFLKWKFQLDRFLNFRFLYVGFNCIWSLKGYRRETCSCISSYLPKSVWETTNAKILVLGPHLCIRIGNLPRLASCGFADQFDRKFETRFWQLFLESFGGLKQSWCCFREVTNQDWNKSKWRLMFHSKKHIYMNFISIIYNLCREPSFWKADRTK